MVADRRRIVACPFADDRPMSFTSARRIVFSIVASFVLSFFHRTNVGIFPGTGILQPLVGWVIDRGRAVEMSPTHGTVPSCDGRRGRVRCAVHVVRPGAVPCVTNRFLRTWALLASAARRLPARHRTLPAPGLPGDAGTSSCRPIRDGAETARCRRAHSAVDSPTAARAANQAARHRAPATMPSTRIRRGCA